MLFPTSSAAQAPATAAAGAAALRKVAHPLAAIIGITAISGDALPASKLSICSTQLLCGCKVLPIVSASRSQAMVQGVITIHVAWVT